MAVEALSEHAHLRVLWDAELGAVHMEWLAPTGGEPFRAGLDEGLAVLVERGATKWLADMRWLGVLAKRDEAWVNEDWFPRAIDAGLRYHAIVTPESSKAQVSIRELLLAATTQELVNTDQLRTQSFESLEDARRWLAER